MGPNREPTNHSEITTKDLTINVTYVRESIMTYLRHQTLLCAAKITIKDLSFPKFKKYFKTGSLS